MKKKLKRDPNDKIIGGVCSGIAKYFEIDSVLVRLGLVLSTLMWGIGPIIYLLMWIIIPLEEEN